MANENRYYATPFAESGNRTEVPNISVGGAVGFDSGFGPDYELPQGSPSRKRIERDLYNGMHFGITKNLKQWQEGLYPTWIEDNGTGAAFSYPQGMIVNHAGQNWVSNEDSNQEEPGAGTKWERFIANKKVRIETSISEIGSGAFSPGEQLSITDNFNAPFAVVSGGTPDGIGVLDAGNGNTAVYSPLNIPNASHLGAKAGGSDSLAVMQYLVDNYGTGTINDGKYTISGTVDLKAGFGFLFPSTVSFHPNANGILLFRSSGIISSLTIDNIGLSGKSWDGATQYTGISGLQINDASFNVNVRYPRTSNMDTGIDVQSNSFGVRIEHPSSFLVENPVVFGASTGTNNVYHPVFDNSAAFGGSGSGNGIHSLSHNKAEGGFIQGFSNGILADGGNGKIEAEGVYFESCPTAAVNLDGVLGSVLKEIFHFGFNDSVTFKGRNCNGVVIENPKQATNNATIGLYDFDSTNINCYESHIYYGVTYNLSEGVTTGILKSNLMGQSVIDTFTPRKTIPVGSSVEMFRATISANHQASFEVDIDAIENSAFVGVTTKKFSFVARNNAGTITFSSPQSVNGFNSELNTANYNITCDLSVSSPASNVLAIEVQITSSGSITPTDATVRASVKARTTSLTLLGENS